MLNNTKIGTKLIGGFAIVLLLMIVIGAAGIYSLNALVQASNESFATEIESAYYLQEALINYTAMRNYTRAAILATSPADIEAEIAKVESDQAKVLINIGEYEKRIHQAGEQEKIDELRRDFDEYMNGTQVVLSLARNNQDESAYQKMVSLRSGSTDPVNSILKEMVPAEMEHVKVTNAEANALYSQMATTIIVLSICNIMIGIGLAIFLSRHITVPLAQTVVMIKELGKGHLDGRLNLKRGDEVGVLAGSMDLLASDLQNTVVNAMKKISEGDLKIEVNAKDSRDEISPALIQTIESLRGLVAETHMLTNAAAEKRLNARGDVKRFKGVYGEIVKGINDTLEAMNTPVKLIGETANSLSSAASEILAATTQQLSGATEQSAAVSQTTTTVDEVKALSDQAVERSQEVVNASQKAAEISQNGTRTVAETVESMGHIKERVEGIAENIVALSERTQQIGEIITTVNEIATQSNMLALNASVEASRAGEYGKGFAAVAGEVRSLAEQSRQSTVQVRTILQDVQNAINAAVMATEEGTKVVDTGVKLAAQTGEAISQLASAIQQASQTASQVMAGGRQQASGVEQVAVAMQNINQVTQQSLASSRQVEKAAQDLNNLSGRLTDLVKQYQI
jgi:methyl-accepting chemotaxis protein